MHQRRRSLDDHLEKSSVLAEIKNIIKDKIMSFDSVLTNFTSIKDMKNKEREFYKNLHLRQKLNQKYDEALTRRAYIEKYDLGQPLPPVEKSLVEERSDVNYQYSLALRKLNSYLRPEVATEVIGQLTEPQIVQLNLYFEAIKKLIPLSGKDITGDYFISVFRRYEEFLTDTGNTGVILPERKTRTDRELMPPPPPRLPTMSGVPLFDVSSGLMTPTTPPPEAYGTPAMSLTPIRPRPPGRRPPVPSFQTEEPPQSFLSELQSRLAGRRIEPIPTPPQVPTPPRQKPEEQAPRPAMVPFNLGELQERIAARRETSELPTEGDIELKESKALQKRKREMILDLVPQLKVTKGEWENLLQSGGRDPKVIVKEIVKDLKSRELIDSLTTAELNKLIVPFGVKGIYKDDVKQKFLQFFEDVLSGGSGIRRKMKGCGIIGGMKCAEPSTKDIIGIIKAGNNNPMLKKELIRRSR